MYFIFAINYLKAEFQKCFLKWRNTIKIVFRGHARHKYIIGFSSEDMKRAWRRTSKGPNLSCVILYMYNAKLFPSIRYTIYYYILYIQELPPQRPNTSAIPSS